MKFEEKIFKKNRMKENWLIFEVNRTVMSFIYTLDLV